MQYPATLVTALYDIGRGQMKKEANNFRPFSLYLEWFRNLLRVNAPLVIFIPPQGRESGGYDLQEFVTNHRPQNYPTVTIIKPFTKLPLFAKRGLIQEVMIRLNQPDPRLEFHSPEYIIVIYSKFDFLYETINSNPFRSKYFFWVDAGYFRKNPDQVIDLPWPDQEKIEAIGEKFIIQNFNFSIDPQYTPSCNLEKKYLKTCPNELSACFMGGQSKIVEEIRNRLFDLLDQMLNEDIVNNEQQGLAVIIRRDPDKFILYPRHEDVRELLTDLAIGTYMRIPYPKCPHLKVLSVATCEIKDDEIKNWIRTVEYFGYDYTILGREDKWGGWPYRTRKYLDEIKNIEKSYEVVILSDATDLFFCGPAIEAYRKFTREGEDIIIGSEPIIYYNESGRNNVYEIEDFFIKKCRSRTCFPNGGFLIGTTRALIKLLEANLDSKDDQAGYMDLLFEKKVQYSLDEKNVFVGNLPNLQTYTQREVSFWKWDSIKRRYYNPLTMEYPIAFHFPGNNRLIQSKMFQEIIPQSRELHRHHHHPRNTPWIWSILIVLLLILVYVFWNSRRRKFNGICWFRENFSRNL